MDQPLISVIVPVYNTKEYLSRCVESLLAQTYSPMEILLVDDGSSDGSEQLCDEFAAKDERIRVFHKENGGSSTARNLGLDNAKGEYIGFVDSDDYVEADMYQYLYDSLRENEVLLVQAGRKEIDEQGNRLADICIPPKTIKKISYQNFLKELLMHRGDCSFCTKLFHRSLLWDKRFPVGKLNEDFRLLLEILPNATTVLSLPDYKYNVFYRMNSNSRKSDKEQFSRVFEDNVDNADWVERNIVAGKEGELADVAFRFGIFQRIDYMLHVPITRMNSENEFYVKVKEYLRENWGKSMKNPYLTGKNKLYLTLFVIAPKMVRKVHKKIKHL